MKTVYMYDLQGRAAGSIELKDGAEMPTDCTDVAPPELSEDFRAVFNGADWTIETTRREF